MRLHFSISAIICSAILLLSAACGGGKKDDPVSVTIAPAQVTLATNGTQQFTASVKNANSNGVTWTVREGNSGGSVTSGGLYTAPGSAGTYHVLATSVADSTKSATATVTVNAPAAPVVTISPSGPITLLTLATQQFTASVTNTDNTAVTWSVLPGGPGGTIVSSGLFTAPATPGTVTVVATSVADSNSKANVTINVEAPPAVAVVAITPAGPVSLVTGGTQQFSATVSNVANQSVTWSVVQGASGGTITSGGLYTAPSAAGTYQVRATSVADATRSASVTINVSAPVVTITPAGPVSMVTGGTQQFTAAVSLVTNQSVTWSVVQGASGGTITSGGLYTAPSAAGTYQVRATSVADATRSASVTINVSAPVVTITPAGPVSLVTGGTQQFTAAVSLVTDQSVTWSVVQGAAGGTITSGGLYTAPGTPGTYTVVATSVTNAGSTASATINVSAPPVTMTYTDPPAGSGFRFVRNAALSSATHLVLDLVAAGQAAESAGLTFIVRLDGTSVVNWAKTTPSEAWHISEGTVFVLGTGVQAIHSTVVGATLKAVISQKGITNPKNLNSGTLARIALGLNPGVTSGSVAFTTEAFQIIPATRTVTTIPASSVAFGTLTVN